MVNIKFFYRLLGEARRKVKFNTPESLEEAHVPTKVSIVPGPESQESQRQTKTNTQKWHIIYIQR